MPLLADRIRKLAKEHWALGLVLLLGLIHGLAYVFLVPPWQHYDEPTHFEYAWLAANRGHVPFNGEFDQAMRREVAASMMEHNFFQGMNIQPNLLSPVGPVWIGISQTNDPPLYYIFAAIPLRILRYTDITLQLYAARLFSLLLYLVSLVAAYGIAVELTPPRHVLRWLLPLGMALLPGYTDLMTAVNNDIGAVAFFSLFLWVAIAIIRRGFSWSRFLGLAFTVTACLLTKNTVFIALPLGILALVFALLRGSWRRLAWMLSILALAGLVFVAVGWGDAASWLAVVPQAAPTRRTTEIAPLGHFVFQLSSTHASPLPQIAQLLSMEDVGRLSGKTVTLGAWIWANQETTAHTPALKSESQEFSQVVKISKKPTFYAFTFKLDNKANRITLSLAPFSQPPASPVQVFYDGVVLAQGELPGNQPPTFANANGSSGTWGGGPFTNLVQNASAEKAWPRLRNQPGNWLSRVLPFQPALALGSMFDPSQTRWYYQAATRTLFETFWGKFGWGQVPLLGGSTYFILAGITLIGLLGAGIYLVRRHRLAIWDALGLLGFALVLAWGSTILRGTYSLVGIVFIPSARYAFPAIIPTMLLLIAGWLELARIGKITLHIPDWALIGLFCLIFIGLDLLSIVSIFRFYY
jgi:hypothetical protein